MRIIPSPYSRQMKYNTFLVQFSDEIISKSISRSHEGKFCRGLELLVHLGFRVIGCFSLVVSFHAMLVCFMLFLSLIQICSCTLHMSTPNTYHKIHNVHMSKCLSFISTTTCQELGYIWMYNYL
jgi:hypothetical protein